jgi:hypothetical protein
MWLALVDVSRQSIDGSSEIQTLLFIVDGTLRSRVLVCEKSNSSIPDHIDARVQRMYDRFEKRA